MKILIALISFVFLFTSDISYAIPFEIGNSPSSNDAKLKNNELRVSVKVKPVDMSDFNPVVGLKLEVVIPSGYGRVLSLVSLIAKNILENLTAAGCNDAYIKEIKMVEQGIIFYVSVELTGGKSKKERSHFARSYGNFASALVGIIDNNGSYFNGGVPESFVIHYLHLYNGTLKMKVKRIEVPH